MIYLIDNLIDNKVEIDSKWVIARPTNYKFRSLKQRITNAYSVFKGKADAIRFYKQ
jgi:hypothetical protein